LPHNSTVKKEEYVMSKGAATATADSSAPLVKAKAAREDWIMRAGLGLIALYLIVAVLFPLYTILSKSFQDETGAFVGLANFATFFSDPSLTVSIQHSLTIAIISSLITIVLAFGFAYALTRTAMPFKPFFKGLATIPLLMPSLLPAISLVYLFGNQGVLKSLMFGASIYGPIGIVMGMVFFAFPHALLVLIIAMSAADARLFEAAEVLGSSKARTFFTVTLPGIRYGLISAFFVTFTLIITDFGVPKVIGGQYNVLATDIYKQVVGRLDFQMGAVVSLILLVPAIVSFTVDRYVQKKQSAQLGSKAVPLQPKKNKKVDTFFMIFCSVICFLLLGVLGVATAASFITFWPYNLTPSFIHYNFDMMDGGGWFSFWNSLKMASLTAVIGTAVIFTGAYLIEKSRGFRQARSGIQLLAMLPLGVPGLVLGLAYVFFFNNPANPLNFLYQTMAILVLCTISHFYTVSHLTAVTALKQMDPEFEAVSASMKVPFYRTFFLVTVPVAMPAILDISMYLFLNAMTTVSAVVFLYSPDTSLASIAVLNMDDAGDTAPAAAMGMMIVYTSIIARILHAFFARGLLKTSQAWRRR
jgi:iron(III) transport system permease protein